LNSLNVLIGEDGLMKVMDFGTSRVRDASGLMTSTIGTTAWIAPELFLKRPYSEKADVFSFAILVWEVIMNGSMPYEEMTPFEIPEKVVKGARPNVAGNK
jgi:serine/threonine protein kinase